ncbi:Hypothetical predicted protein [Mytilus galloprovincialis]|uniref:Uncharacterized protein n=1 Tax=Mytilus galloprovincialis TaxID=29158 RepID=A0A8B6CTF2_MYTGA|nr:Hypothetical predicted protein [Mytilus galloprovincialis]
MSCCHPFMTLPNLATEIPKQNFQFQLVLVCISQSAVHTKFQTHSERGKKITADLKDIMERTYNECLQACEDQAHRRQETADELEYLDKQLDLLIEEIKDKIKVMVEEVERNVSFALNDEIKRLSALVDDFARPFHPDNLVLSVYKKELHKYIDHTLCRNLEGKCSGKVLKKLNRTQQEITDRLAALLKDEERAQLNNALPKRDFEIAYKLDCRNLCSEFQEGHSVSFFFWNNILNV